MRLKCSRSLKIPCSPTTVIIGIPQEKVDELVRDAKRSLEQLTVLQAVDRTGTTDGSLCEICDFLRGESYATEVRLRRPGSDLCRCSLPVCPGPDDGRRYES